MSDEWKITESLPEEMKSLRLEVARLKEAGEDQYRKILQLEQDCERYRLACLAARDAFGDWDIVADRMWCSEGMRTILGVPEVVEHAYDWWVRCMHPDDREIMIARLKRALDGKDVFDESEFRVRTAQDAYIDIIFRIFIKRDKDGKPLRMLGLAADNSHRKKSKLN